MTPNSYVTKKPTLVHWIEFTHRKRFDVVIHFSNYIKWVSFNFLKCYRGEYVVFRDSDGVGLFCGSSKS
ncbi:hypothetical protein L2E82_28187 [Cichorium intybus]|uniref:Uncharacterized protein n=1 Tax=Cichorium intybus TaxID=13427 RepID=A0ACB9CV53_CICIN|nr:hypothetical protein L2E82_28187 [Cichorium intybus]